ncbi:hypothetical protein G5S37_29590 [Roseimicrobium sp. ORNL1]|nr:hypothetical protein G5S37_29590 [Roseimicrobium sp. ORNL1]
MRWLLDLLVRYDIWRILRMMTPEDRETLRAIPETELIFCHHSFGMFLRNAFRGGQFPGLCLRCRKLVEASDEPMSHDALSSVAIREIWKTLRQDKS